MLYIVAPMQKLRYLLSVSDVIGGLERFDRPRGLSDPIVTIQI